MSLPVKKLCISTYYCLHSHRRMFSPKFRRLFSLSSNAYKLVDKDWKNQSGKVRVKVCCILNIEEAKLAIRSGATELGLVSWMPSGPGPIEDDKIREIARAVPPSIGTFLLTCKTNVDELIKQIKFCGTNTVQLCDRPLQANEYKELREALPHINIVQVIHVMDDKAIEEAQSVSHYVDALLLDSGNLMKSELGGTGRVHDWVVSRKLITQVNVPVWLAGGLTPSNVKKALELNSFGLDLCSGLRIGPTHTLDPQKVYSFFVGIRETGKKVQR